MSPDTQLILSHGAAEIQKTFPTPVSGLPDLIFDEGFNKYKSYCAEVGYPLPQTSPATIKYEDEETKTENILFMINE